MFDGLDKIFVEPKRERIPLFGKGAVGLHPFLDMIALHKGETGLWKEYYGLSIALSVHGKGPSSLSISNLVRALRFRLKMPGTAVPYEAEMEGWTLFEEPSPGIFRYKPVKLTLTSEEGEDICFALLDNYSLDPGFPFCQFGTINEVNKPVGVKERSTFYQLGVNFPIPDAYVPGWAEEIPSQAELMDLMKPGWWTGVWEIEFDLSSCVVDANFKNYNYYTIYVKMGKGRYDEGELSYVGFQYVGDETKSWPANLFMAGILSMLSGNAAGKQYAVVSNFKTDDDPPPGLPPNECLLKFPTPGNTPMSDGAAVGDLYHVRSPYDLNSKEFLHKKVNIDPGSNPSTTVNYSFETE